MRIGESYQKIRYCLQYCKWRPCCQGKSCYFGQTKKENKSQEREKSTLQGKWKTLDRLISGLIELTAKGKLCSLLEIDTLCWCFPTVDELKAITKWLRFLMSLKKKLYWYTEELEKHSRDASGRKSCSKSIANRSVSNEFGMSSGGLAGNKATLHMLEILYCNSGNLPILIVSIYLRVIVESGHGELDFGTNFGTICCLWNRPVAKREQHDGYIRFASTG